MALLDDVRDGALWRRFTRWMRVSADGRPERDPEPLASRKPALLLTGGGARGVYQVGVLRYLAEQDPAFCFPIITGVSAGSINAAHLAAHAGDFVDAASGLKDLWSGLTTERIFEAEASLSVVKEMARRYMLPGSGRFETPGVGALLDTSPLRRLLSDSLQPEDDSIPGIAENIDSGRLDAIGIVTTNYATGRTETWVEGREFTAWDRPYRVAIRARISLDHVMASCALPMLFPAVKFRNEWHGDGGVRLTTPLGPALHLGADRILALSTRYDRTVAEAKIPDSVGYPPPARIAALLLNAIFLDNLEQDSQNIERINTLLRELPEEKRHGLREVETLVIRPSQDLGKLAKQYEVKAKGALRFLLRIIGVDLTRSADLLSMIHFEPDYLKDVMQIGYEDARRRKDELEEFLLVPY